MASRAEWMNENAEAIVARPMLEDLPPDYIQCIKHPPRCCGYLEKLSSSKWAPRWQIRYFELFGHYLIYNNHPQPSPSVTPPPSIPLCYIDLRKVTIELSNACLYLTSNDRQLRIQQCHQLSSIYQNDDQKQDPELSEWIQHLRASQHPSDSLQASWNNFESRYSKDENSDDTADNVDNVITISDQTTPKDMDFPKLFQRYMFVIGMLPWDKSSKTSVRIMYAKQLFIILVGMNLAFGSFGDSPPLKCANSIHFKNDGKDMPCILLFSLYFANLFYYLSLVLVYVWLLKYGTQFHELIRTHRLRMVHQINRFARYWFYFQFGMTVLWIVSYSSYGAVSPSFAIKSKNISTLQFIGWWIACVLASISISLAISAVFLPSIVISTMYYAESRRLRYLLKDFTDYMQQKPFNMKLISCAYVEMHNEWKRTQSRMGIIMSVLLIGLFIEVLSSIIGSLYTFTGYKIKNVDAFWWTFALAFVQFMPMFLVILMSATGANKRAVNLHKHCTTLIAESLIDVGLSSSSSSDTGHSIHQFGHYELKPLLRQRSSQKSQNKEEDYTELDIEMMDLSAMKRGQDVMKLCDLIERLPCELRLLGRPVSEADIAYLCGFLIFVQVVNLFGVSWAIPL